VTFVVHFPRAQIFIHADIQAASAEISIGQNTTLRDLEYLRSVNVCNAYETDSLRMYAIM